MKQTLKNTVVNKLFTKTIIIIIIIWNRTHIAYCITLRCTRIEKCRTDQYFHWHRADRLGTEVDSQGSGQILRPHFPCQTVPAREERSDRWNSARRISTNKLIS